MYKGTKAINFCNANNSKQCGGGLVPLCRTKSIYHSNFFPFFLKKTVLSDFLKLIGRCTVVRVSENVIKQNMLL